MKRFSKFILLTILGWKIEYQLPNKIDKYVLIAAPHTSWVDFPMGLLFRYATGENLNYLGKASLFKWPFGFIFRFFGGIPVERSRSTKFVNKIVSLFNSKKEFKLALSPEGTRKKVAKWKTGFYYIAKNANVPIIMVSLNFREKIFKISKAIYTTNSKSKDFKKITSFFKEAEGKNKDLF